MQDAGAFLAILAYEGRIDQLTRHKDEPRPRPVFFCEDLLEKSFAANTGEIEIANNDLALVR